MSLYPVCSLKVKVILSKVTEFKPCLSTQSLHFLHSPSAGTEYMSQNLDPRREKLHLSLWSEARFSISVLPKKSPN